MKSKKSKNYIWDEEFTTEELVKETITFEEIELKNKLLEQQEKLMARRKKKYNRYSTITAVVVFILLVVFVPVIRLKEIKVSEMNYLTPDEIYNVADYQKKYYSLFEIVKFNSQLKRSNEYIDEIGISIDFKQQVLNVNVVEDQVLAVDGKGKFYFKDGEEILTRENAQLNAPLMMGFNEEKQQQLLNQLAKLEYSVVMSIETITYAPSEENANYLELKMNDGVSVGISIDQISEKMPYYLQMSAIIEQKAANKDGKLHLDLGDYYEPKK